MVFRQRRRNRGSATGWIVFILGAIALVIVFREPIVEMFETKVTQNSPLGTVKLFTQCVMDRNAMMIKAYAKPGHEQQVRRAIKQLGQLVDSHQMSEPGGMRVSMPSPRRRKVGDTVTARVVILGVSGDTGANLTVTIELMRDKTWRVTEAAVTGVDR